MSDYYFNTEPKSTNVRVDNAGRKVIRTLLTFLWRWAPKLTRWLTLRLFFTPPAYSTSPEEKSFLAQGRPFTIRVHDKNVCAWRWGQGPGVLLVHGWGGRGSQFSRFVPLLVKAGFTAIAVDMPGHGSSPGRIASYFEFTDTIRGFISKDRALDVQAIIAHSFGAAATINALVKEKVAPITVCIAPILRLRELIFNTFERYGVPDLISHMLIAEFEKQFGYHFKQDNPVQLIDQLCGPVLVIHDKRDRTAAFHDSVEQVHNHAHLTLMATHGLGHRRLLTDETVVQACLHHLTQQRTENLKTQSVNNRSEDGNHQELT